MRNFPHIQKITGRGRVAKLFVMVILLSAAFLWAPPGTETVQAASSGIGTDTDEVIIADEALLFGGGFADEEDEAALFGGGWFADEAALFGGELDDEAALFGGGTGFITEISMDASAISPEEELLTASGVEIGGDFSFSLDSSWFWQDGKKFLSQLNKPTSSALSTGLRATIYLDARPDRDYRVFAKAKISHPFSVKRYDDPGEQDREFHDVLRITELFADFHHKDEVFFRAGKQKISWGVGYFFSPADIINLTAINPEDPEADREGPVALKINKPVKSHNTYLYILAEEAEKPGDIGVAPKAEIVFKATELGLGAYYRQGRKPSAMATISSSLGKVALFGEAVVKFGSDKNFLKADPPGIGAVIYRREDELFYSGTAGFMYTHSDDDGLFNMTAAAQYYYNGEGYDDPRFVWSTAPLLMVQGKLTAGDLAEVSKHYAAAMLSWQEVLKSDLSANLFWLGDLSGQTGYVTGSLAYSPVKKITTTFGVSYSYGAPGGQFTVLGNNTSLFFKVALGSGRF